MAVSEDRGLSSSGCGQRRRQPRGARARTIFSAKCEETMQVNQLRAQRLFVEREETG
jgi:hypothetical protein